MLSAYPGLTPAGLSYESYVALWLNLDRVRLRQAWALASALEIAHGSASLPRAYIDALCPAAELTDAATYRINAERAEQRVLGRLVR